MTKSIATVWLTHCLAAFAAIAPFGSSHALESLVYRLSISYEGHCTMPHVGAARREDDYNISEIIIDEENGQWLERFVAECFALKDKPPITPRQVFEGYQASEESHCPDQSQWTVLLEEPHRLLFEQRRGPCANEAGRLLLGLAIHGQEDRWLVTYSALEPVRNPADRQVFLDILETIELVTMTSPDVGFPVWGPTSGPAWVGRLVRDHEWSDGRDVVSPLPIPSDWTLTSRAHERRLYMWVSFFTPPGQGFDNASEALVLTSVAHGDGSVQALVEGARADLKKRCGAKARLDILLQEQDRMVSEAVAGGCRKVDYEYRLTAYLSGTDSLFRVEYLARKAPDPIALHDTWAPRVLAIGIRPLAGKSVQ